MASVPGNFGIPLVGDKSVEFYKDAVQFVDKKIQLLDSRVFATRFLNKPTVFVASNVGVQELLNGNNIYMYALAFNIILRVDLLYLYNISHHSCNI